MARNISVGIDVGSASVKVVIAEEGRDASSPAPKILGTGQAETRGLEKGYIVEPAEVSRSVRTALDRAEKAAGFAVKRAFISVGGAGLGSVVAEGTVAISRADLEVTDLDLEKAQEVAEGAIPPKEIINKKIINSIPLEVKIDGKPYPIRVEGMHGGEISVKMLFITCLEHHLEDLIRAVEGARIEVIDVVAAPIAASFVTLSKKQKRAGCLLLNIGFETTSMVVFEKGNPISLEVLEAGGNDITENIALGLRISLEEAESIKLGGLTRTEYPKRKLDDIVSSRLNDIFGQVNEHLKKIGRQGLLPAGIVLGGGGASLYGVKEVAEHAFKLPAKIGEIHFGPTELRGSRELPLATAYGLTIVGFNAENERGAVGQTGLDGIFQGPRKWWHYVTRLIGKLLP